MSAPSIIAQQLRITGRFFLSWLRSHRFHARLRVLTRLKGIALATALSTAAVASSAVVLTLAPENKAQTLSSRTVTEQLTPPDLKALMVQLANENEIRPKKVFVRNGETLTSLMARLGITDPEAVRYIRSQDNLQPLVLPQPGQYVSAGTLPDGRLAYLRMYLEGPHERDSQTLEVTRHGDLLIGKKLPFSFDTIEEGLSGSVDKNFQQTVQTLKIPENVADQLAEVWEGAVNPIRELQTGDKIRLIFERKFADGNFIRNGQLLAAQIVRQDQVYEAYWFADGIGAGSFYTLDGRSSKQTFMRIPLEVQEVSSEFAALRRHPVTGVLRPHNGTDFRAPKGARIFAAADGVVTFVGYERKGYGKYLKLDHGLGRTTLYAHMSKIAPLKRGMKVRKGDVIGYVGRTGLATGPHLHYELMLDGVQINPRTADLPDTENLSAFQLAQLRTHAEPLQMRFRLMAQQEADTVSQPISKTEHSDTP